MEGEGKTVVVGQSILVPSVQELAKQCLKDIPDRYVWSSHLNYETPTLKQVDHQLPIINMQALLHGDQLELANLHSASQFWGFFQVINHGISSELVENFKLHTQEFFDLPLEEKKKYWQTPTDVEGFGQAFILSEDQKLNWGDMFYLTTLPKHLRRPSLLPNLPSSYRETLEVYSAEVNKLAKKILEYMAKALKIESEANENVFGEGHQSMRMNYYPPCPQPNKAVGLAPHSDAISLITILLQLNEMEGLQIMHDSKWISIKPLPHAFVVNVGDILEIMSNGKYRSVLHQAVVNSSKERLSVATFHCPALENEIGPIPDLVTSTTPAKFRRMNMLDYWRGFMARPLDGKTYLDVMRILDHA